MNLYSMDVLQYFGFIYFRVALHTKKQPRKIESSVQYFIFFFLFFLIVQNPILAWEGARG